MYRPQMLGLRVVMIAATVSAIGCPSSGPTSRHPQSIFDDTALRIRIARAEAMRAAGIAELTELVKDPHVSALAMRGLGRIGGDAAIAVLRSHLSDSNPAPAYAAIGLAASLDDTAPLEGMLLPSVADDAQMIAIVEAFGRAAGVNEQKSIVTAVRGRSPAVVAAGAFAIARMARRKIAYEPVARDWLVAKTKDLDPAVRYATAYALAREHQPIPNDTVNAALARLVSDDDPETRATAIAALTKRNAIDAALPAISAALRDRDWRVAVEAARALVATREQRDLIASNLERRWAELDAHPQEAQVLDVSLRSLLAHPEVTSDGLLSVAKMFALAPPSSQSFAKQWVWFEASVAGLAIMKHLVIAELTTSPVPSHVWATLAEAAYAAGDVTFQRELIRTLLESKDARERADGLGLLATASVDVLDRKTVVATLGASVASTDPVISGAAADAIGALYKATGTDPQLDAALVARAAIETEPELLSGLLETIGTYKIASGADACRAALARHPIAARAGAACLKALGQAVLVPAIGVATPPPVDVAAVIGKQITWKVMTTAGEIDIALRPDIAPWNVATIVELTRKGFYNGIEFHRVVPDFVVQGGDPTMSGVGGPGFVTPAEPATSLDQAPGFAAGGIGIADAGRDSGGSQWFAMHSRAPHLDGRYTYIGQIVTGQTAADSLLIGDKIITATIEIK